MTQKRPIPQFEDFFVKTVINKKVKKWGVPPHKFEPLLKLLKDNKVALCHYDRLVDEAMTLESMMNNGYIG